MAFTFFSKSHCVVQALNNSIEEKRYPASVKSGLNFVDMFSRLYPLF